MDTSSFTKPSSTFHAMPSDTSGDPDRWLDVVDGLGAEIAGCLTRALDRVQVLVETGQIDRNNLRALHQEIQQARQTGMAAQHLARMATGKVRQMPERQDLTQALKDALNRHAQEFETRNIAIHQALKPAQVIVDASFLFNLTDVLIQWTLAHAGSNVEFCIETNDHPKQALLRCNFSPATTEPPPGADVSSRTGLFSTVSWRLVEQTAWALGLPLSRQLRARHVELTLQFPRLVGGTLADMSTIELDQGYSPAVSAKVLANSQILVVASRREVRNEVPHALRNMGLVVDFVNSMEEARRFCQSGLPHAIIMESILRGEQFNQLRGETAASEARVVFIEILEEGTTFEISGFNGLHIARVGRDAIDTALPSALTFELSKTV